ncbi:phage tail protein [Streptomyces sp. NPDC002623]
MNAAPDKKTSARTSAAPAHQAAPAQARATVEEPTSSIAVSGPESAPPAGLTPQQLRLLQAGAGNAAVARLVVQRQAAAAPAADAPAPPVKPPPSASPAFQNLKSEVQVKKTAASRHAPAATESKAAQNAAVAPPDDKQAQGKAAQAEKMNAAKPGVFDKAGFIAAVNQAIAAQAPKNLDEADNFSGSGKAEAVKGQVSGQVSQGKAASAKEIDTATKAGPDLSKAQDKPVTPLTPDAPPPAPAAPNPAGAVPATQPDAVTDFSGGPQQVDQQMAEAEVTEDQLAKGNEPQFTDALTAKKEGEQHSATAPGAARGAEAKQLAAAKQGAAATGAQAMTGLAATRTATGKQVDGGKGATKSADERKRAEVTARLQKVFDTTKTDVESTLSGLDKLVDEKFTAGEKAARDAFTADHKRRMDAYKDKRYSGWTGKLKWVKDKFAGMPEEANQLFQESRKIYVAQMQQVISSIADVIGTELGRAKDRIAKGRAELKAEVDRLPADLKKFGQDAAKDFTEKFDGLEADVNAKSDQLVQDLAQKYTQALNAVDDEIKKLQDENKGLIAKAKDAVVGVIQTIIELKNMLLGVLAKAATAVMNIIKDPIGFLRNLVTAVAAGLHQFIGNITEHLKKGLISWLLGTAVSAGLALPAKFDLKGIIQLIGGMLGLTWANIRARITRKGVPDQAVTAAEQSVPVAQALQKEGPAGAVEHIKASVGDLKSTILQKLTAYLIPTVIVAGITWIVSLLNPASAFIRAVKGIIDIVTFVVTQGAQIMQFVNSVLDAVIAIAGGGQAGVPALIEGALVASIPVLIGFLAALLGVGNLANKVKEVFHAVAKPVSKAIDKIVDFIAKAAKRLWAKLKGNGNGKGADKGRNEPGKDGGTPQQKAMTAKAAATDARSRLIAGATPDQMHGVLEQVHQKYAPQGLKSLRMEDVGEHQFRVAAKVNPEEESELIHLPVQVKGDEHAMGWTPEELRVWTKAQETAKKVSDETSEKLKNTLENKAAAEKPKREPDPPTFARGVFKWTAAGQDDVSVVKAASSRRLKDHSDAHQVRGAHAEEHLTLYYKNKDLPSIPTDKQLVPSMSLRYEINRSPCVNCATYIADFVEDLRPRTQSLSTVVLASALYEGSVVFTGEIRQRYRKIFDELISADAIQTFQEFEAIQKAKAAEKGKEAKELDKKKIFSGVPRTQKAMGGETARRTTEWDKVTVPDDVRREWFRIRPMEDHGVAGLAILRAHGITVEALTAEEAGVDRSLTDEEKKAMTEEDKEARKAFLLVLKRKNDELLKALASVKKAGVDEKDDSWVVNHGYVGGR